jgi:hypothetical protein
MRLIVAHVAMLAGVPVCFASDPCLTNLTAVRVIVQVSPDFALAKDAIQTDTELKLRLAGMRVVKDKNAPILSSIVVGDARAAAVSVVLNERVMVVRNSVTTWTVTWTREEVISQANAQATRGFVKDLVDVFLNDWLEANPARRRER